MDKLLINNALLTHKKTVQKAKTVTINKLVQKIRKLKALSEKKPDDKNIAVKILRTTEIIACIKQLKQLEILKKALVNDKNLTAVITNGRSEPLEIAEALLFSSKTISCIINDVKKQFNLDDDCNRGWRDKIQELSKKQLLKEKIKQKQEIRKQRNELNIMKVKRTEWIEQNLPEHLKLNNEEEEKSQINDENQNIDNTITSKNQKQKSTKSNTGKNVQVQSTNTNTNKLQQLEVNDLNSSEISEEEEEIEKSVDPFFITASGASYLATAVVERYQPDGPNDGLVRKERRAYQTGPYRRQSNPNANKFLVHQNGYNNNKEIITDNDNNSLPIHKNITENTAEVHPSWAAKQKQKGIKEFSGKKITFDDTEIKTSLCDQSKNIVEKVHPSWEAKQKQKGIKEFTGKKIVFNDREIKTSLCDQSKSIVENVHPSWAAKQKQKGIKEFSGKKITFDIDEDNNKPKDMINTAHNLKRINNSKNSSHYSSLPQTKNSYINNFGAEKIQLDDSREMKNQSKHPSWEAKQKQKGIKTFTGKKTVFSGNRNSQSEKNKKTDNIHNKNSSWKAKEKPKGIQTFNSKKVGSDVKNVNKKPKVLKSGNNHGGSEKNPKPYSYLASIQKISGIKDFAGKKIKFGDDETNITASS